LSLLTNSGVALGIDRLGVHEKSVILLNLHDDDDDDDDLFVVALRSQFWYKTMACIQVQRWFLLYNYCFVCENLYSPQMV